MSDRNYAALRDADKAIAFIERCTNSGKPIAFDIEAGYTGEDKEGVALLQFHPEYLMVGISFTVSTDWARYIPIAHDDGNNVNDIPRVARALWKMLWTGNGVAHNLSYELKGLSRWFREVLWDDAEVGANVQAFNGFFPFRSDTMIEVYLSAEYDPMRIGKDLKSVALDAFGLKMTKFMDLFPNEDTDLGPATKRGKTKFVRFNTRNSMNPTVIAYACEDSVAALMVHEKHYDALMASRSAFIFKTELGLLPVLVEMEMEGMLLDWKKISEKSAETLAFKNYMNEEILQELSERLGEVININLQSVPQLSDILFNRLGLPVKVRSEKTEAPSTSEAALRAIAKTDPVIKQILEWREVSKLHSAYLNKYDTQLNYGGTGRAYPNHNQAGALTGRLSVDGVSYQQWPKPYHYELKSGRTYDFNFRDLLISPPDFRIIGYDFSQVELRVLAAMANERAMLEAFASGVDIHKATASSMMNIPLDKVTKKQRSVGKTLNFAVVYGSGAANIAEMLTTPDAPVSTEDAEEMLEKYFAAFSGLRRWMDARVVEGREAHAVYTFFGRRFRVWEYMSQFGGIRKKGDRMCVNAPVQGGAADYMKIGMIRAQKAIRLAEQDGTIPVGGIRLIMTVHDALEFYVHKDVSTQTVIDIVQPAVSFPVKGLPVEIRADWHEGMAWGSVIEIKQGLNKQISHYAIEDVEQEFATIEDAYAHLAQMNADAKAAEVNPDTKPTALTSLVEAQGPAPTVLDKLKGHPLREEIEAALHPDADTPSEEVKIALSELGSLEDIPVDEEDEAPWLHNPDYAPMALETQRITVTVTEMPDEDQWAKFNDFLTARPGADTVAFATPEGEIEMDTTHSINETHQAEISLILGGAAVAVAPNDVKGELVMEGMEL